MASSSATLGDPPQISQRTSSKRALDELQRDYLALQTQLENARKRVKPSSSFDASYWASAAVSCDVSIKLFETEMKLAIRKWNDDDGEAGESWWATQEARRIIEKIKAATFEKRLYEQQAQQIERGGPVRRASQAMFTTSQLGICADRAGVGARSRSQQCKFKASLIKAYDAATMHPNKPKVMLTVHDSATGLELIKSTITAAHLVPPKLGPDILVALFGVNVEGELYTPFNGLLLHVDVEKALDDGAIAIVPDLPDDPTTEAVAEWEAKEPKEYRWQIIDSEADSLDELLVVQNQGSPKDITIRDLDGQRLSFKNDRRPRARYLYFLYVVAQLKMAWRHDYRKDPTKVPKSQLGKGFWATRRRYLNRALLLALAEEIGHDTNFPENIPPLPGADNDEVEPDQTGLIVIAKLIQAQRASEDKEEEEEEAD